MVAEALRASGRPHPVRAVPSMMMTRTELKTGPTRSAWARNLSKSLVGIASPRWQDNREELQLKARERNGRRNGGSLHGKLHSIQGGAIFASPASNRRNNIPTARVKPIQDGYRAMPGVNVPNSRLLADHRNGEKDLISCNPKIMRSNEQIGISAPRADNFDLIESVSMNGALTLNDVVNLVGNGKRIVPA